MSFFVACVSLWTITVGSAPPTADGVAESRLIGGYAIHQLLGPFDLPTEVEAVTCDRVQRRRVGGGVLPEEQPERIGLEAANEEEAMQQLQQLAMRRHEERGHEEP
jgi:hypothetical protein